MLEADPGPWLDGAGSVMHLRASCPEPSWLVHCAYWAGIPQDQLYEGAVAVARHAAARSSDPLFADIIVSQLRALPYDVLAKLVREMEKRYPVIRGIEQCIPSAANMTLLFHLGERKRRPPRDLDPSAVTPDALIAGGMVLMIVATFHRAEALREALALCCGALGSFFALAVPGERQVMLDLQRAAYGWPSSMTSTTFVK